MGIFWAFWYIEWSFGIFLAILEHFPRFFCTMKNLATLRCWSALRSGNRFIKMVFNETIGTAADWKRRQRA
jgi:hypothetical protein